MVEASTLSARIGVWRMSRATITLGREQELASYDAAYLELAIRLGLPLVTLDERLTKAATRCSVLLFNPEAAREN